MGTKNLISLTRPIDFKYQTNIAIFAATLVISLLFNFNLAIYFFLGWAIAREIDIDHPLSAFLSSTLVFLGYFYFQYESIYIILFVLILLRTITNITGNNLKFFDYLLLLILFILSVQKINLFFNVYILIINLFILSIFNYIFLKTKKIKTKCDNNNKKVKINNYKIAIVFFSITTILLNSHFFALIIIGILSYNIARYFGGVA